MKRSGIALAFLLLITTGLAACGAETPAASAPPATAEEVSLLTDPEQATAEATEIPPTFTPTPSPQPTATDTPLPPSPTATPSPTPEPEPVVTVNETLTTQINVRAGPGTNYPIVARFEPGQAAIVTGRNADESWWQVNLAGTEEPEANGWVFGELVTLSGDNETIPLTEAPPPPPPSTPDPNAVAEANGGEENGNDQSASSNEPTTPDELADQLRCGKDFCVTYQAMVPIWENGGCIGNHSIYVTVLEGPPPGRPMDGVVIGDTFGNVEVASGDKGPGSAEVTLWMNSMSLKVKRRIDGTPYTSEESFSFTSHDELIPAEVLAANGYCDGSVEKCRAAQQQNQVCRGHYSYRVTFHKFD
jgi:uncharacterized protein YraI